MIQGNFKGVSRVSHKQFKKVSECPLSKFQGGLELFTNLVHPLRLSSQKYQPLLLSHLAMGDAQNNCWCILLNSTFIADLHFFRFLHQYDCLKSVWLRFANLNIEGGAYHITTMIFLKIKSFLTIWIWIHPFYFPKIIMSHPVV